MGILSPIDDQSPVADYDPTQSLHTPGGVLPPIMSGDGSIAKSPDIEGAADQLSKRGLLSHDLGKQIYSAEKPPEPAASPGTIDWYKQRGQQIEYQKEHPWGSPISAHPGVLGKIFHGLAAAGNIAGDVLAPGTMSLIPGTQLNRSLEESSNAAGLQRAETEHNQETEAAAAETKANAEQENADTAAKPKPEKPEDINQQYADAVGDAVKRGVNPLEDPTVKKYGDAIQNVQKQPQQKPTPAHVTYDQGIPVSITDKDGSVYDINDPKLPAELKPLVDSANRAHGQHVKEDATKQAQTFAQQEKMFQEHQNAPTTQERNVRAQAGIAAEGIPIVVSEIDKLKDQLGPVSGRWNEFMQGSVGMDNPDLAGLRSDLLMVSSAVALAHARGRLPENLREEFDRTINSPKQDPENLKAALNHILPWMQRMQNMTDQPAESGRQRPANVPEGYVFKTDGPKGRGWYKP